MKVLLTGILRGRRGAVACRVYDISRSGAAVDADCAYELQEAVTFERGTLKVSGTIAWSRGHRFGVRFDVPIRATELLVQMSHSRKTGGAAAPVSVGARLPSPSR